MSRRLIGGAIAVLLAGLAFMLVVIAAGLPTTAGLAPLVATRLADSGVQSEVTAVLLNFRAYDTLLEVGVLLLAVIATRSLHPGDRPSPVATRPIEEGPAPSPLLLWYAARLMPVAIVVAGYLWWAGSTRPGGAFQGGTVLGAALALLLLAGRVRAPDPATLRIRLWLTGGLLVFIAVALAPVLAGDPLLTLQRGWSGLLIVAIEAALTVSIGVTLAGLVIGVPARPPERAG